MADATELGIADFMANPAEPIAPRLRDSLGYGVQQKPDAEAELRRAARELNMPMPAVKADPDYVRNQKRVNDLRPDDLIIQAPATARWIAAPENAAVAHDDLDILKGLEGRFTALGDLLKSAGLGFQSGSLASLAAADKNDPIEKFVRGLLPQSWTAGQIAADDKALGQAAELKARSDAAMPQGRNVWERGVNSAVVSVAQGAPGIAASLILRNPAPALAMAGTTTGGNAYLEAKEKGLSDDRAAGFAMGQGLIEAGTELLPMGKLIGDVATKTSFFKLLTNQLIADGLGEQAATILQDLNEDATLHPEKTLGQYLAERPEAAAQTAIASVLTSGAFSVAGRAAQGVTDRNARRQAKVDQSTAETEAVDDMMKEATASKVRERDPQTFKEFVDAATVDTPSEYVYVAAEDLMQAMEATPNTLEENAAVARAMPSVAAQLPDALASGGLIQIPISELLAYTPDTALAQTLMDNLKVDPQGFSKREAEAYMQEQAATLEQDVAQAVDAGLVADAFTASRDRVEQTVTAELNKINRFTPDTNASYAKLHSQFISAMAARQGILPEEFAAQHPLAWQAAGVTPGSLMAEDEVAKALPGAELQQTEQGVLFPVLPVQLPTEADGSVRIEKAFGGFAPGALNYAELNRDQVRAMNSLRDAKGFTEQDVALADLVVTQRAVNPDFKASAKRKKGDGLDLPAVYRVNGRNVLADGHHRATAALAAGDTTVKARVYDVDAQVQPRGDLYQTPAHYTVPEEPKAKRGKKPAREANLVAVHNITEENLRHVERMGGMAAPSFAVVNRDMPLDSFGDITLVASPAMIDPKGDRSTKVFGADIYSPRYPTVSYKISEPDLQRIRGELSEGLALLNEARGREFRTSDLEGDGLEVLRDAPAALAQFLIDNAIEPKLGTYSDGTLDIYDSRRNFHGQIEEAGLRDAYSSWVEKLGEGLIASERIFNGFTYSGNRKYLPHTLDTVVRLMKQELRGGESFNYGVPNIRAQVTPEFRSLKAIQEAEGSIVSDEAFEAAREEIDQDFADLAERLREKSPWGEEFGYLDTFSHQLAEAAQMRRMSVLDEYFNDLTPDDVRAAGEFLDKLRSMPTEYFEGKWLRPVQLSEFAGAVVPENLSADARAALEAKGLRLVQYDRHTPGDRARALATFQDAFFQDGKAPQAKGSFTPSTNVITILRGADLSTALHELGHFYLETLARVASEDTAPPELKRDWAKAAKYIGYEGADPGAWLAIPVDARREGHETWARSFEAYLREGKAPAPELKGVFQRFKAWLVSIYKDVKQLNVQLTDEVRGVFDRLVATEEQIAAMQEERQFAPLFATKPPGMTDPEWIAYQELEQDATATAQDELAARSIRDMRWTQNRRARAIRELEKEARETRKAVRAEVTAEVKAMPVYAATDFLKRGTIGGEPSGMPHKLSIAEVEAIYADNPGAPWQRLGYGKYGMLASAEGENAVHPDQVAEMFGFTSGDHLVRELLAAEPVNDLIEGMTDQRLMEQFGDLKDRESIERAADEAIHNDVRLRFVATEANALAKATGKQKVLAEAARSFAADLIGRQRIRDLRPAQYTGAATKAAVQAQMAASRGDLDQAAAQKRNQLINAYAARAALEAQKEADSTVRYLKRLSESEGLRKSLDANYRDQIDALLERFDLRTSQSLKAIDRKASLTKWVEAMRAQNQEPVIDELLLNEAYRTSYKNMTVEELRGLRDAVKNIAHLGKLKNRLLVAAKGRAFQATVDDSEAQIRDNAYKTRPVTREYNTAGGKALRGVLSFTAWSRKYASIMREMSGAKNFDGGGILYRAFIEPKNQAEDREARMRADATKALHDIFTPVIEAGGLRTKKYLPELGTSLSLEGRLSAVLNMGNQINRERLLTGERWTDAQADAIAATLTPEQLQFINRTWEYLDSFWPQIAAKQRRVTGVEPEKVDAEPFFVTASDGSVVEMRGGYYPIKYETERSSRSEADELAEDAINTRRGLYAAASTRRGHTKARVESTGRPIRYDLGVVFQHVNQVIHDLAFHEYLIDANRLIGNAQIEGAIMDHYGPEYVREIKNVLLDIADGGVTASSTFEKSLNYLRTNATVAGLGLNVVSAIVQPLGLMSTVVRIGPKHTLRGIGQAFSEGAALNKMLDGIWAKSEFMALRGQTFMREIAETQNQVRDGLVPAVAERIFGKGAYKANAAMANIHGGFFYLMQKMQLVADVPTWLGAYDKGIAQGLDEQTAVGLADQAVRDSQGSGYIGDMAGAQRGHSLLKLFTQFYTPFSAAYNLLAEGVAETRRVGPSRLPLLATEFLLLSILPGVFTQLIKDAIRGELGDDEQWERLADAGLGGIFGLLVGVRDIYDAASGAFGLGAGRYTGPSGLRFLTSDLPNFATQVSQGEFDEPARKATINFLGGVMPFPAAQVNRTVDGIMALADGRTQNPTALLFGAPPKE